MEGVPGCVTGSGRGGGSGRRARGRRRQVRREKAMGARKQRRTTAEMLERVGEEDHGRDFVGERGQGEDGREIRMSGKVEKSAEGEIRGRKV